MYERLDQCPICKSGNLSNFLITKDYSVTQESFAIVECKRCSFKFTNPRPSEENIAKYYQSENYISHSNKGNNLINTVYKAARYFTVKRKVKFISEFHSSGNLLDIGCGTGDFIQKAKEKGWNVLGVEPGEEAQRHIPEKFRPFVYQNIKEIRLKNYFHIVTLWHVLEHIYDLSETIKKIKKLLSPEGRLVIAVPNCESFDAQHYKQYWAAYDVPRHLYHFTPKTMQNLLATHKLRLIELLPYAFGRLLCKHVERKIQNRAEQLCGGSKKRI